MKLKLMVVGLIAMAVALVSPTAADAATYSNFHRVVSYQSMLDYMGCSNVYFTVSFNTVSYAGNYMNVSSVTLRNDSPYNWNGGFVLTAKNGTVMKSFNGIIGHNQSIIWGVDRISTGAPVSVAVEWRYSLQPFGGGSVCTSNPGLVQYAPQTWT